MILVFLALGCGGGGTHRSPDRDAGPEGDAGAFVPTAPVPPAPPAPAAPPLLLPCAAGWREVPDPDDPDVVVCDPWPGDGPDACAADEAHFPGGAGCERIGPECPAGSFADDLPASGVVYVLAGAAGGDGSFAAPFGRIEDALAVAVDGDTVALSTGDFAEVAVLDRAVTLRGACVLGTRITTPPGGTGVAIFADGAAVEDLWVEGGDRGIVVYAAAGAVSISRVVARAARWFDLDADGAFALTLEDVALRDASGDFGQGTGAMFSGGIQATLRRVSIERAGSRGVHVQHADTSVALIDSAVLASGSGEGYLALGEGIEVTDGSVTLTRSAVMGSAAVEIDVNYLGGVTASDSLLADLPGVSWDAEWGTGISIQAGGRGDLERVVVRGARDTAIVVMDEGSSLHARDLVVEDATGTASGFGGAGLQVSFDADTVLTRAAFLRNRLFGVLADLRGTLVAEDLRVRTTHEESSDDVGGYGVQVSLGAAAELTRADLTGNRTVGLLTGADTVGTFSDVRVAGTLGAVDGGRSGYGAFLRGAVTLERMLAEGNRGGIVLWGATVDASDVDVQSTGAADDPDALGYGLSVVNGADASLGRARVTASHGVGILVGRASLAVTDLSVEGTRERACAVDGCAGLGHGISAIQESSVAVERFVLSDNEVCGVQIALRGQVDLRDGEVSHSAIGANVQDDDFDVSRLLPDVIWLENGANLDGASLPLPDLPEEI